MNFFGEMAAPFVTTIPWKGRSRRNTRALRSIFIFASHAFDRAHRNPWLRFRDKIVFPKINCSRRLGVSRTERAVSRPLVQEAVGSPRTAMMMECRERQTYAKDSCW